ncbi:ion transporter [Halopseudomonas pelagia]|uniref:ion transporter n=1 Tax=Halopseudomonas pelagia TaxID=553151 RepID=UPI0003B5005F|nr:ion transporter [Halopseudomonas pelagia]|tara:strand:- start:54 stop:791 length:738 start_codon:yes stop_codon:yes gene_type:complete
MLHRAVDPSARTQGVSLFNLVICVLILMAVLVAILETEQTLVDQFLGFFRVAEWLFFVIFVIEFCLRVYVAPLNPRFSGRFGRFRYLFSFWALIDLLALLPFLLTATDATAYYLRLARLFRVLRIARLGRFTQAWRLLGGAFYTRRYELLVSALVALLLLLVSSTFLYLIEAEGQPEAFGSVPRALWWSVATLTTVGYGDVTPDTAAGQFFAGLTAVAGIGLVAMPTGILAAAFSDAFQKKTVEN